MGRIGNMKNMATQSSYPSFNPVGARNPFLKSYQQTCSDWKRGTMILIRFFFERGMYFSPSHVVLLYKKNTKKKKKKKKKQTQPPPKKKKKKKKKKVLCV